MKVSISSNVRFVASPDRRIWVNSTTGYDFWQRYLHAFDSVTVIARVQEVTSPPESWLRVDGPGVNVLPLPYYVGPRGYLFTRRATIKAIRANIDLEGAIIHRAPGQIAPLIAKVAGWRRPYGVEVVGDPYEVFAPGVVNHPLRPLFRWSLSFELRKLVNHSSAAAYVSCVSLPGRYPVRDGVFMTTYSSVELDDGSFVERGRTWSRPLIQPKVIFVGSLERLYKAPDTLIRAVADVNARGLNLRVTLVGDGRYRRDLESLARELGVDAQVNFTGNLSTPEAVRRELDAADIFVLASRTEGLPRAMIEAMARGLPCIGSPVGGIPELLETEHLVPGGEVGALATRLIEFAANPEHLASISSRNLKHARAYHRDVLQQRREEFYEVVRDMTASWNYGGKRD